MILRLSNGLFIEAEAVTSVQFADPRQCNQLKETGFENLEASVSLWGERYSISREDGEFVLRVLGGSFGVEDEEKNRQLEKKIKEKIKGKSKPSVK